MNQNHLTEASKQPGLLMTLTSLINPTTMVVGAVGLLAYHLFNNNKEDENPATVKPQQNRAPERYSQPLPQPLTNRPETVEVTVEEPLESTAHEPFQSPEPTAQPLTDDQLKAEMIRQTMSELGKRSAAARAKKAEERREG